MTLIDVDALSKVLLEAQCLPGRLLFQVLCGKQEATAHNHPQNANRHHSSSRMRLFGQLPYIHISLGQYMQTLLSLDSMEVANWPHFQVQSNDRPDDLSAVLQS